MKKIKNERPQIFAVRQKRNETGLNRRQFVGLLGASAALSGFNKKSRAEKISQKSNYILLPDLCGIAKAHLSRTECLATSPDGELLVSGSIDSTIKLWRLPGGELLTSLEGHSFSVNSVAIGPDGTLLASGDDVGNINLWRLPGGELLTTLEPYNSHIKSVAISPDGTLLASNSIYDRNIRLWSLPGGKLKNTLKGHTDSVMSIDFNSDGTLLASGGWDNTILLWDSAKGEIVQLLADPECELQIDCGNTEYAGGHCCLCDSVNLCICDQICTCDTVCSSDSSSSCGGSYWYPN